MLRGICYAAAICLLYPAASVGGVEAQERSAVTVFENVRIFDGKTASLSALSNVVIRGNIIDRITTDQIAIDRRADTQIIAGGGRVLMPGLSDAHWHAMLVRPPVSTAREGRLREDIARITQDMAREFEFLIRRAPDQPSEVRAALARLAARWDHPDADGWRRRCFRQVEFRERRAGRSFSPR